MTAITTDDARREKESSDIQRLTDDDLYDEEPCIYSATSSDNGGEEAIWDTHTPPSVDDELLLDFHDEKRHSPQPTEPPPDYFTSLGNDAAVAQLRRCTLLPERPATWLVKKASWRTSRNDVALCPLAATALIKTGLLLEDDLELISRSSGMKRDPADPLSAVFLGVYDVIGDITLGLARAPIEFDRQNGPALNTAKEVAIGAGKGLGDIVGAGLKSPMTFTHGLTRGFHNFPKLYGEEVHEYENVVGIKSGLAVSGKSFVFGVGGGLKDFFVKPVEGAQKEGVWGFGKGLGKGIGNLVCKPVSGAIGLVGYSSAGVYKEIQGLNPWAKDEAVDLVKQIGDAEYEQASESVRIDIVSRWHAGVMKSDEEAL